MNDQSWQMSVSVVDPTSLPLFTQPAQAQPRPGRVRSTFSFTGAAALPAPVMTAPVTQAMPGARPGPAVRPGPVVGVVGGPASELVPVTWRQGMDWSLVAALRSAASERLMTALEASGSFERDEQHALGRRIIAELLEDEVSDHARSGRGAFDRQYQGRLAQAVFDALFRLGRLQPLVDDPMVENITILGCDEVWLEYADGRKEPGPPVADSDQELIDFLVFLASRSEVNARQFSEANPRLHMRLDGGARLAATAWVTPRPSVVVRRHRLREATLQDLVAKGSLSEVAASFLAAAVRARRSIVVAGPQGAGKTTMVRALCAEIPAEETIGTFETEYELHLHEMKDRHPIVHAWEARPGGEMQPNGRRAGEFTLDDALYDSYRFTLSRQIVGEVRGSEVMAMIEAMQSGTGSLSTTHAESAERAVSKLVTCAMKAGAHVTEPYAVRAISESLNIVVHVDARVESGVGGSVKRRWTSQIVILGPGEKEKGYSLTTVFACPRGSTSIRAVSGMPEDYRDLEAYGFDLPGYLADSQRAVV